jgi:hypothetical protein
MTHAQVLTAINAPVSLNGTGGFAAFVFGAKSLRSMPEPASLLSKMLGRDPDIMPPPPSVRLPAAAAAER